MSVSAYPSYRDSCVEWLGEVPTSWGVAALKHFVDPRRAITYGIVQAGSDVPGGVPYIRPADMSDEQGILDPSRLLRTTPEIASAYRRSEVQGGDLVCSIGPSFGKVMVVPQELTGANLTQGTARVAVRQGAEPRFVFWALRSEASRGQWRASVGGATFGALNLEPLANTTIAVPPLPEQAAIAAFLDRETGKIDALVEEQRRLIELLKEKRQAVISHAVTKGLDPTAPTKDSGVEWLGEVPADWEVRKLSSIITKITNGYVGPTRDILVDDGVRYLQSLHIKNNTIRFETPYYVTEGWSLEHAKSILEAGDVLVVQTGDIGQSAVVTEEYAGCNCHALIVIAPVRDLLRGEWLAWTLNADYGVHSLLSIQTGALHPHLNCGNVRDLYLPLPPLEQQDQILEFIAAQTSIFDPLIAEAEAAITLLSERRGALISAAVTGKIDVRGIAPASVEAA